MKKLTNNGSSRHITHLQSNGSLPSDTLAISEASVNVSTHVSSASNHDNTFLPYKLLTENFPISFDPPPKNSILSNLSITKEELATSINKNFENVAPGLDNIHPTVLENLNSNALSYHLSLFNATLQSTYPQLWETIIILLKLKPNSTLSFPPCSASLSYSAFLVIYSKNS